ncbi:helix-turn-helix domain-containing protein [Undibacterium sp. JH2W]|uniref:helix-turn-helix domain-containing protein n=1 Tax=Undibacterium sp. JH2W TaxID=3413037 RepID=UPI003BF026F7
MKDSNWDGELWLAKDYAVLHGALGVSAVHAHHAHQLILSPDMPASVALESRVITDTRIWIESMCSHAILAPLASHYSVYAEPYAYNGQELLASMEKTEPSLPTLMAALQTATRKPVLDARVETALAQVDRLLSGKISASKLADDVHVSLSQLERLFSAQLGLPVRRLVLWRRLRLAIATTLEGQNLTTAAHAAGFADSAHFSRTMRSMFGVRADHSISHMHLQLID